MNTIKNFIFIIGLCVIAIGATTQTSSPKWEYKFVYECNEKKATALGLEGWELTAIQSTGPGLANNVATYVFKRQK